MASVGAVWPAVTTTVQATYLTGAWPAEHGIVGNGWYFRDECEIRFWRQSNKLVQRPKIWEAARRLDPKFTCANLFWWYNMYSGADYAVTPRPMYPADGRKIPDIYTQPGGLRFELQRELGQFPLFNFWGPATSINATQWIAESAILLDKKYDPTLTLIYLPHLDYCLQRHGPEAGKIANDLRQLDDVCQHLIGWYSTERNARIIVLSEYGIVPVSRPVHLNRILRNAGLVAVREELGREVLDPGASRAFVVADHQVAHVYINDPACAPMVRKLIEAAPGVARVLDEAGKGELHLNHERSGELVALAEADSWFTYYYWIDDRRMPDFARTVDIHRKPGYDPAELFIDPAIKMPKAKLAWMLLKKKLGFRTLMEVIPPEASLVRGSHGLAAASAMDGPVVISQQGKLVGGKNGGRVHPPYSVAPTEIHDLILRHLVEG